MWRQVIAGTVCALVFVLAGCAPGEPETPRAPPQPADRGMLGITWSDPYSYLEDTGSEGARTYLQAEQAYFDKEVPAYSNLRDTLAGELNSHLPVSRQTRPVRSGDYMVFETVEPGSQYPVYKRYPVDNPEAVETVLDVNELAQGASYFDLGDFATLDEKNLVAYTADRDGNQKYNLRVKFIGGSDLPFPVSNVGADITWHGDRVVYIKNGCAFALDAREGRLSELGCHQDEAGHLMLGNLGEYITITEETHETTHVTIIPPSSEVEPLAFTPRKEGHRYRVMWRDGLFYALTNREAPDFRLVLAQPGQPAEQWTDLLLPGAGRLVDVEMMDEHIAIQRRYNMQDTIWLDNGEKVAESLIGESLRLRKSPGPGLVEYVRRSYLQPDRYYVHDTRTQMTDLVMEEPAAKDVDVNDYTVERRWYPSGEVEVPVTLVYRHGAPLDERPLLLTGYAAYGISLLADYDPTRFPLLDRDIVFGIVHARGGGELGVPWHEDGRGLNKRNTFADFIAVTEALRSDGVGAPGRVAAMGASAGGTLMGVIANERPELYSAIVARVPFVDLVTTLSDVTQTLTQADRLEWGDPERLADLQYLRDYSPYEQVRAQAYPNMLVVAATNDSRVPLYEPLKWMAKLRANHMGDEQLLLKVVEGEGHLGATDQYDRRQAKALEYAFILKNLEPPSTPAE